MHYIKIPQEVELTTIDGTPVHDKKGPIKVTFEEFLLARLVDPKFTRTSRGIFASLDIKQSLKTANGTLAIDTDPHFTTLKTVVEEPSPETGYPPALAHNFAPFIKAILEASTEEPKKD